MTYREWRDAHPQWLHLLWSCATAVMTLFIFWLMDRYL